MMSELLIGFDELLEPDDQFEGESKSKSATMASNLVGLEPLELCAGSRQFKNKIISIFSW